MALTERDYHRAVPRSPGVFPPRDLTKEGNRWWSRIQVIADDKMEGRNTTAAKVTAVPPSTVAQEFERAGEARRIQQLFPTCEIYRDHRLWRRTPVWRS